MNKNMLIKKILILLLAVSAALTIMSGCTCSEENDDMTGKIKIVSYNVLVEWAQTSGDRTYNLDTRLKDLAALLKKEQPDSFGVQECSFAIKEALLNELRENYGLVGTMDTGGMNDRGAFGTFIFYNKAKYDVVETKNFWLSETPDYVSAMPGSDRARNGCWVILKNKETGEQYGHVNVHLEWTSKEVNSFGAEYTSKLMNELAGRGLPVFCTGDFNVEKGFETVEIMTERSAVSVKDSETIAAKVINSQGTYLDSDGSKLDYCFVTDESIDVLKYSTIGDFTISDHLGVMVICQLK